MSDTGGIYSKLQEMSEEEQKEFFAGFCAERAKHLFSGRELSPAMERESVPEMFNVVGNELRKLQADVARVNNTLVDIERILGNSEEVRAIHSEMIQRTHNAQEKLQADVARNYEFVATMVASLENRIMEQQRYGESLARIEAQLTALRAATDKYSLIETELLAINAKLNGMCELIVKYGAGRARKKQRRKRAAR